MFSFELFLMAYMFSHTVNICCCFKVKWMPVIYWKLIFSFSLSLWILTFLGSCVILFLKLDFTSICKSSLWLGWHFGLHSICTGLITHKLLWSHVPEEWNCLTFSFSLCVICIWYNSHASFIRLVTTSAAEDVNIWWSKAFYWVVVMLVKYQ